MAFDDVFAFNLENKYLNWASSRHDVCIDIPKIEYYQAMDCFPITPIASS